MVRNSEISSTHVEDPRREAEGLSHHGDPADDEVIVVEEPKAADAGGPRVLKIPRVHTQREIDAHMATHLPHES